MGGHRMIDDFAKYFLEEDAFENVQNEVIFSLLKRYNCFAGCKICYTQNDFQQALPRFKQFIPTTIDPELEKQWFKVFDYFYCVSNIDDIFWMKHEQSHLYEWYQKHGHMFQWGNMTDNNFIRSQPLFINEFTPETRIYEISFSARWLEQIKLDEVFSMLDDLQKRNGINKIKFIFDDEQDYALSSVQKMFDWTYEKGINEHNCSHHNFMGKMKLLNNDGSYPAQSDFCASDDGKVYNILGQSDYLQYDNFFLTLQDSISVDSVPYYNFSEFDHNAHLYNMIQGKLNIYKKWADKYHGGEIQNNPQAQTHFEYFDWVSKNVKANKDYNYIPINLLQPNSRYFNKLKSLDWTATELGLIKKDTTKVVPLVEIANG